jgi:hypothetical protein
MDKSEKNPTFETRLLKWIAAELYFLAGMNASREMYGKSYFSLGVAEKQAVDGAVWTQISGNFQQITPQLLGEQPEVPKVGFHPPGAQEQSEAGSSAGSS